MGASDPSSERPRQPLGPSPEGSDGSSAEPVIRPASVRPSPAEADDIPVAGHFDDGPVQDASSGRVLPAMDDVTADAHESSEGSPVDVAVVAGAPKAVTGTVKAPKDTFIGKSFGGYELIEPIGQGGMGMVYRGRQVSLNRDVAVKLLNKALVTSEEFIKRFKREARAMATIHHPNIVSVIDFGESEGVWYMVAEFVEGTNLAKLIRERVMVPPDELVPIIIQCLSALAHVSKNGVVHRDIKPDNILLDMDKVAKIADFGLAKDLNHEDTDLTAVGSAMGTPSYMSPEQCMGRQLDVRSDIYSLGVTAYFALTGEKPFTGQSSFEIMTKQREFTPPPPLQLNPQLPKEISALVMRMIEKNPSKRHADADACRQNWIEVGQTLGYIGSVTRSGQFLVPADLRKSAAPELVQTMAGVAYPEDAPPPPAPSTEAAKAAITGTAAMCAIKTEAPSSLPAPIDRVGSERMAKGSDHGSRAHDSSSLKRIRAGSGSGEVVTCPRCGHLNRGHRQECERCQSQIGDAGSAGTPEEQMAEADRCFRQGRFREASRLYGRLAEQEKDRRQRSILRTKEREARTRQEEDQIKEAEERSHRFVSQGDIQGAIKVLDRALGESTSQVIGERLQQEIAQLHRQVRRRKRRRRLLLIAVIVLVALGAGGVVFREAIVGFLKAHHPLGLIHRLGHGPAGGGGDG